MTRSWTPRRRLPNRAITALAFLALAFAILVPPGFMPTSDASGHGLAIVICTGHGPLIAPGNGAPDKKGAAHHDNSCAFAGHGVLDAPPILAVQTLSHVRAGGLDSRPGGRDLTPGRGLAAPPPPSQGPPHLT